MTKLLIIESPGKQATIKKYLGADWMVLASLGHIRGLEHNLEFIQRDFEPKYEWLTEKAKAIKQLKDAAKEAEEVYLAADRDFEGEQIAYSVCLLLKLNPATAKRITFTEITQKAILAAIQSPGRIDMNRVHTQQCRSLLDLLIGFTMSPLLWKHVAPSLSAGRCQTPAVRLVVEREDAIQSFEVESSWRISGEWHKQDAISFGATMTDELGDEESASNYLENVHTTPTATIKNKTIKPYTEYAPEPLITSTLQQQASALYHSNPKNTMRIAQRLYEAGHITYMRTDQPVLSEEARQQACEWVLGTYGAPYIGPPTTQKKKKAKKGEEEVKAQEAHEAIRPTHMELTELVEDDWTPLDRKIYRLIWQRTIQSVMAPLRGESCSILFQIIDDEFTWASRQSHTVFEGWRKAGTVAEIEQEDGAAVEDEKEDILTWERFVAMNEGDTVSWTALRADMVETKAKGRYNEATLVKDLETYGIGRPSTFASLLAVIQEKGYVESKDIPSREIQAKEYTLVPHQWPPTTVLKKKKVGGEKNKLVPTELGRSMLRFMLQHFEDLFAYTFTAKMEKRLDAIAEGQEQWKTVMRDMWESYKDRYDALQASSQQVGGNNAGSERRREWANKLVAVITKKGPLLLIEGETKEHTQFLGWPKGVAFQDLTEEQARAFMEQQRQPVQPMASWNGEAVIKKSGKFGPYLECGDIRIPFVEGETLEQTHARLEAKKTGAQGPLKAFKDYVVRTGPYGPYIMKTSLKKAQFVSLPKEVNIHTMTQSEVEKWYKLGLVAKKEYKKSNKSQKDT